jgi:hypothetical protein
VRKSLIEAFANMTTECNFKCDFKLVDDYKRELIPTGSGVLNGVGFLRCGWCQTDMSTKSMACGMCGMTTNVKTSTGGKLVHVGQGGAGCDVNAFECGQCGIICRMDVKPNKRTNCGTPTGVIWNNIQSEAM